MNKKTLIETINKQVSIVEVYEKLTGNSIPDHEKEKPYFVAVCPFHDDSRPSLSISPTHNSARCFADHCIASQKRYTPFEFVKLYFEEVLGEKKNFDDIVKWFQKKFDIQLSTAYNAYDRKYNSFNKKYIQNRQRRTFYNKKDKTVQDNYKKAWKLIYMRSQTKVLQNSMHTLWKTFISSVDKHYIQDFQRRALLTDLEIVVIDYKHRNWLWETLLRFYKHNNINVPEQIYQLQQFVEENETHIAIIPLKKTDDVFYTFMFVTVAGIKDNTAGYELSSIKEFVTDLWGSGLEGSILFAKKFFDNLPRHQLRREILIPISTTVSLSHALNQLYHNASLPIVFLGNPLFMQNYLSILLKTKSYIRHKLVFSLDLGLYPAILVGEYDELQEYWISIFPKLYATYFVLKQFGIPLYVDGVEFSLIVTDMFILYLKHVGATDDIRIVIDNLVNRARDWYHQIKQIDTYKNMILRYFDDFVSLMGEVFATFFIKHGITFSSLQELDNIDKHYLPAAIQYYQNIKNYNFRLWEQLKDKPIVYIDNIVLTELIAELYQHDKIMTHLEMTLCAVGAQNMNMLITEIEKQAPGTLKILPRVYNANYQQVPIAQLRPVIEELVARKHYREVNNIEYLYNTG